jgi:hypothetical protein
MEVYVAIDDNMKVVGAILNDETDLRGIEYQIGEWLDKGYAVKKTTDEAVRQLAK